MAAQVILTTLLFIVPFVTCLTDCVVEDIPVQYNVDIKKFWGRWYEIKWAIPHYLVGFEHDSDYTETYSKTTDGDVHVSIRASSSAGDESCDVQYNYTLHTTDNPAKLYWVLEGNDTRDSHMVTYTCDVMNETSGVCAKASAYIWSRQRPLPAGEQDAAYTEAWGAMLEDAYASAGRACLEEGDFTQQTHDNECTKTDEQVNGSGYLHLALWTIILCSFFISVA